MRICYVADIRLPTEKAHGLQIMKTCEALARAGNPVELVVPRRVNSLNGSDPFAYYSVLPLFTITRLATLDLPFLGRSGFYFQKFVFSIRVFFFLLTKSVDIVYGRDELALALSWCAGKRVAWESHTGSWSAFARFVAKRACGVVVISQGLRDFYIQHRVPKERIVIASDGVDLEAFEHPETKTAVRERLGLPQNARVALYLGRIDGWKGVDTLAQAATLMPDVLVVIAGGEPAEVERARAAYPHVRWLGYTLYRDVADNQQAADVLVLPNTGASEVSARFTSPLKLFTYMASGVPIVASDLPSIREVLSDEEAYFAKPDDPKDFARAIYAALSDALGSASRAREAGKKVRRYSWDERSRVIVASLSQMC